MKFFLRLRFLSLRVIGVKKWRVVKDMLNLIFQQDILFVLEGPGEIGTNDPVTGSLCSLRQVTSRGEEEEQEED